MLNASESHQAFIDSDSSDLIVKPYNRFAGYKKCLLIELLSFFRCFEYKLRIDAKQISNN